jgi:patatin-related protein
MPNDTPQFDPTQEVRFAVVLYGGLSLAIYMNGVAQELLRLVRATAPESNDPGEQKKSRRVKLLNSKQDREGDDDKREKLEGTECVYRKLGQMLIRGGKTLGLSELRDEDGAPKPISTRFVVDVISGTSAGGINGVFLAKALANDQSMNGLRELWISEGDFGRLMNDRGLAGLAPRPQSVLDGKHMYAELLKALEGMEGSRDSGAQDSNDKPLTDSPYAEEIDLFVTATDISGLTLPLQLADGVVDERRHRNTFHFVYSARRASGERRNDFTRRYNPFLAFAARSTSAFPVAFEPMRLSDIDAVVPTLPYYQDMDGARLKRHLSGSKTWRAFFEDYLTDEGASAPGEGAGSGPPGFSLRAFADGGALDNKPFSYATDTLLRRRADLPVDRKLLFVDPDPQNPEQEPDFDRDVDVLENTLTALSPTVSTETIREDIQRILERNRLIERIRHITYDVETDVQAWRGQRHEPPLPGEEWARMSVREMILMRGIACGGHHRLKVAAVTDELATIIINAANLNKHSDYSVAVRDYVRAWRDLNFKSRRTGSDKPTQNKFLIDYDLSFRLRRLNFVRSRIDELSYADFTNASEATKGRRKKLLKDLAKAATNVAPPGADGWGTFQNQKAREGGVGLRESGPDSA